MINPFKKIKQNSRWTIDDMTIVIYEVSSSYIAYYYLSEWWNNQTIYPHLFYISKWKFILKAKKYKFV